MKRINTLSSRNLANLLKKAAAANARHPASLQAKHLAPLQIRSASS